MIIDFEKIAEIHQEGFKGGKGLLDTRNYVDEKVKIMYSTLRPGASSGLHTHEGNCEVIFLVSGTLTFHHDLSDSPYNGCALQDNNDTVLHDTPLSDRHNGM